MMNKKPHILLVDDKGSVLPDIQDALIAIGIAPTFIFIIPEDRKKPVEKKCQAALNWIVMTLH